MIRIKLGLLLNINTKKIKTDLLNLTDTSIDAGSGIQSQGNALDHVKRSRFSLSHEYNSEQGWLQNAKTQIYYQDASTENDRLRLGSRSYRAENAQYKDKTFGIVSNLMSYIDGDIPQVLRYGFSYNHTKTNSHLRYERPGYDSNDCGLQIPAMRGRPAICGARYNQLGKAYFDGNPSVSTKQDKFTVYFEDEISFGKFVVTPQVGFVHYRVNPTDNHSQIETFKVSKRHETNFAPKLSLEYRFSDTFIPYAQYSHGVRTPSSQQLTSYFFETPVLFGQTNNVAVVGNPSLHSETADNFEIGVKGKNSTLNYLVTGYYNRYHNFIDFVAKPTSGYTGFIQYDNLDRAKVYGITADMKWNFYDDFYTTAGLAYSRGKATNNGVTTPINSIQPMKTKLGFGYEGDKFGANIQWTYNRAKSDKDIESSSNLKYNPTGGYSLFDFGMYWKPVENLTLTANVNNIFDKKYWNWNDISYITLLSKASQDNGRPGSTNGPVLNQQNADRYTAPGRNFNVGVRYEF